jgi:hypothetical protein
MLASQKTLTNSIILYIIPGIHQNFCSSILSLTLVDLLHCTCHGRLSEKISVSQHLSVQIFLESWAAFRMPQKALRRRLLKGFIELVNVFIEARKLCT